jgi:hypothetical protein
VTIETIPKDQTALGFDLQKVWMTPSTDVTVICSSIRGLDAEMKAELLDILLMPQIARGHRHK